MEKKLDLIIEMIKEQGKTLNSKIDGVEERLNTKIDSLRGETNEQYDSINQKYDSLREEMNEKYTSLDSKYDSLKEEFNTVYQKLDNLSNQVTLLEAYAHEKCEATLDGWVSHLEKQEELGSNVTNLNSKTENHEIRITVLEDVLEA